MSAPTKEDWGHIHAMAWRDASFRELLESDPRKAIDLYGEKTGKSFTKIVSVSDRPAGVGDEELHTHDQALAPPACC